MNFFSEERASELRELFFESAQDLLQELNEAGILLESDPANSDALARVRRAMHTLKGDAAACGFRQISELAHDLEDLLTPALVTERGEAVAEIVLSAADSFHAMLGAHRGKLQPPDITALRAHIHSLAESPKSAPGAQASHGPHEWTQKEKRRILDALHGEEIVYQLTLRIDPSVGMPAAALQLVRKALDKCGDVLAQAPASGTPLQTLSVIHAVLSSSHPSEWIRTRCHVPSIVTDISVERLAINEGESRDAFQVLLEAESGATETLAALPSDHGHTEVTSEGAAGASGPAGGTLGSAEAWLRVETARIDAVMNLIGELIIGKSMLHRTVNELDQKFAKDSIRNRFGDVLAFQSRVLNELQKSVLKIRMVPVEQLFRRLPRIVRDVAKARQKEITIETAGQETDLDKSVLDALSEPMAHLVRNAADHGIEPPEERIACGKTARGTIRLDAYHQGNQVVIEISDDGRGIDREKVLRKAIETGIVTSEEVEGKGWSQKEVLNLVFQPGLTTADAVTAISGRGVGMDVVKSVMDRLKGKVLVQSEPGRGTTFQLFAPLTLASIQALMFSVEKQHYAVPLDSVIEITRASENEIHKVDGREVIRVREQVLSVVRLDQLTSGRSCSSKSRHFVVTISSGSHRFGLVVDGLIGEEELVIKAFQDRLVATELVSGASILGDGTVVLILNVPAVVSHLSQKRPLEVAV
ncbi:MAG TPA: chemotaxis protein CheA [Candidatus Acidoferrales bacterium]|nr:chemotaxis protein CheA [Candidatus Acidoferrales bacterium]